MTRKQRKTKRLQMRRRNRTTTPLLERHLRQRWASMFVCGFVGVLVVGWVVRAWGIGGIAKPAALLLGWMVAAGVSFFLKVRV